MKKERKEQLLLSFPAMPVRISEEMQGKGAMNFVVFVTNRPDGELFARCYHRYSDGKIIERQRYVFAPDGCVRYGKNDDEPWKIRSDFREPVFCQSSYGYTFDNSYCILNADAIKESCMKYAPVSSHTSLLFMEYLRLCCKHPNFEYLVKQNYDFLVTEMYSGYWGTRQFLSVSPYINWKSNNLLKMLGLNRSEFKALQGQEKLYESYRIWRDRYEKTYSIDKLLLLTKVFGGEVGTGERFAAATGLKIHRIARYLSENNIDKRDYSDYLTQCRDLHYDLCDTAISMPHNFEEMHCRLSAIFEHSGSEEMKPVFAENYVKRKRLNYENETLMIRQPETFDEIVVEGKILNHCVGGYAKRHTLYKLHIMFIRRKSDPTKPFYTVEVSEPTLDIIQVRGKRNATMTEEVRSFVEEYKKYLDEIKKETMIVKELK